MENTQKYKKTYEIVGKTENGRFVCIGFCSSIKNTVDFFTHKYPRFKGYAEIRTQMAQDLGDGVLIADACKWETVDSFESTKELKQYKGE